MIGRIGTGLCGRMGTLRAARCGGAFTVKGVSSARDAQTYDTRDHYRSPRSAPPRVFPPREAPRVSLLI